MRAGVRGALFALCALGAGEAGCSGAHLPVPARRVEPPTDPAMSFVSPARWDYHPPAPATAITAVKLPDGGCLFTAEGGQRWSAASTKDTPSSVICSGKAETSFAVAPEDLTSAIRRADGTWIYASESGVLYEAKEPLGAFTRTVLVPEPLAKVAGAGAGVLAATQEGKLLRWEADKGWHPASSSPALAGARVFDLVVGQKGRVLALGFPEAIFASEDDGATWKSTGAPLVGARRLGATSAGDLGAQGIFESVVWRGGASALVRAAEKIIVPQASLDVDVGRAPSATAVQEGRAVLDGDRYYEVVHPDSDGDAWQIARGHIEGRLETLPLDDTGRCANLRIGARGKVVFVACILANDTEITTEIRRSTDAATSFGEPVKVVTPDASTVNISVSPDGGAMVTGVCRVADAGSTCKPGAPLVLRDAPPDADAGADAGAPPARARDAGAGDAGASDGGAPAGPALQIVSANAPQLSGAALAPAFGGDSRLAYFLGRRGKDDRITLFVSHDGGESFSPRTLQAPASAPPVRRPSDDEPPSEPDQPDGFEIDEASALHPGDDGTIGLMVSRWRGGQAYVTADDDGRVLQVAGPPTDNDGNPIESLIAGFGRRVLAFPTYINDAGDPASTIYWESLDGGVNWERLSMPQALLREYSRGGGLTVTCAFAGCVIGDTVARVGWGGTDAGTSERPADQPSPGTQSVLTPIVCELAPASRWSRLDDVYVPGNGQVPLPAVNELMRGRSVWSSLSLDRTTGALTSASATLPESGEGEARVVRRPLIGPRAPHTATAISPTQVEGYAVVRAPYAVDAKGQLKVGTPVRNVEIAWENFFEGSLNHARIADAGPLARGDVSLVPKGMDVLNTALISISSRGFFTRLHASRLKGEEIFVDPSGRLERYTPAPWPSNGPLGSLDFRGDAGSPGGELLGVGILQDSDQEWAAVVLAKRAAGGAWGYTAETLLPPRAQVSTLNVLTNFAWSARAPVGALTLLDDPTRTRAWAEFVGFKSDGTFLPAQPVPTLFDLGERPRPCTPADRAGTPRTVMQIRSSHRIPLFPGARHPVLVQEPRAKNAVGVAEPMVLLTGSAVLHGTPSSPCLAAFHAESATNAPMSAVLPGDLARSWLFRYTFDAPHGPGRRPEGPVTPTLEYRPMACHYDANARIPEVVWTQDGTTRP